MSTKTISKRIALGTVVALGAGVLSLVSVSSANAYAGVNNNSAAGTAGPAAAADVMNIGTAPNTTGSAVAEAKTAGTGTTNSSVGLVNVSDISGGLVAGTTQTATLLSTGKLVVYTSTTAPGTAGSNVVISVTGGTLSANSAATGINSGTTAAAVAVVSAGEFAVTVSPNSGATSMQVVMYDAGTTIGSASASSPTAGTLVGSINVTIASSSSAGTVSTAKSGVYYTHAVSVTGLTADDSTTATEANPNGGTSASGVVQTSLVRVRDAYATAIVSTTGLLTANATNGAYVQLSNPSTAGTATQSSAFMAGSANSGIFDNVVVTVKDPNAGAPLSTTVTLAYNGVTIGTKTYAFTGDITKITLSAASNGSITSPTTGTATIAFSDSAGNAIYPSPSSTNYPGANIVIDPNAVNTVLTAGTMITYPVSGTSGVYNFTCGTVAAGKAPLTVRFINNSGVVTTSNALAISCANSPYTYAAALDKSTYSPGDIATLTVTFKDSKGNVASDVANGIAASGSVPSISGGNMSLVNAAAATDATTNGVITYKLIVDAPTSDPYGGQLVVSFPVVNTNGLGAAQTVGYKITSGGTSLNDVLKGIVSLIASINKQIAALAKLVTKK
jgi:hypothetical protein